MLKTLRIIALLAFFVGCSHPARADKVDDYVREQMRDLHISGLSLAVVRAGKVLKSQGYGYVDVEQRVPATGDSVYEVGSITKQFTAVAVMMLVEENKIGLDESISRYLNNIPASWRSITVRQLLSQTSGLKEYFSDTSERDGTLLLPASVEQILKPAAAQPLGFEPGESWDYSNTNYYLLGLIIAKASGKTYADFLQERIFTALGMTATQYNDRKRVIPNRARGYAYDWGKGILQNADRVDPSWSFSAGAIISSVNDLAKWDAALDTEKLIRSTSKNQMWTPGYLKTGAPIRYGFGWYVDRVNGHTNLSHGGDIFGFASYFSRYPEDHLTVIVSLNQYIYPKRIADTVAALFLPSLKFQPIPDTEPAFTALVQKLYVNRAGGKSDLWEEKLFASEYWPTLKTSLADTGNKDFYQRLGSPKSVALVERIEDTRGILVRYRVSYGKNARIAKFVRDRSNKITAWDDYEE